MDAYGYMQNPSENLSVVCVCSMDLGILSLEMVEIINKIAPNEDEVKQFQKFSKEKRDPSSLAENDRFLFDVSE